MIGWLVFIAYCAGYVFSVVPFTRWYLREVADPTDDDSVAGGVLFSVLGVLTALFWPLILVAFLVYTRAIQPTIKSDKP